MILETINSFNYIAFTGSRETVDCQFLQIKLICENYQGNVLVGDAKGIDAYVRKLWQNAEIFNVSDYWTGNLKKAAFAVRSQAMIKSLHSRGGLLIAFPSKECPEGLKPSKSAFNGYGSGTWATAAYAIALDVPVLVWLPVGLSSPVWLDEADDGWWQPKFKQLSLF
jgi:hypothetical protein